MPITLKTTAMKARESVNDPWETITVKAEAELEPVLEITGDGDLDPGFTATDLTGAVNELKTFSGLQTLSTGVSYCKIGNVVQITVENTGITENTTLGTLPLGYRPAMTIRVPNHNGDGNMVVSTNGNVMLQRNTGVTSTVYFVGATVIFAAN